MYSVKEILDEELRQEEFLLERISKAGVEIPGSLRCRWTKEGLVYYLKQKNSLRKLGGVDHPTVQQKKAMEFNKKLQKALMGNQKAIRQLLKRFQSYQPEDIEAMLPEVYRGVPENAFEDAVREGIRESQAYKEAKQRVVETAPYHITADGTRVRSKSEVIIYNLLLYYNIPFKYEQKLILRDEDGYKIEVCPDFTIYLADGSIMIIEHFGMLGNPEYAEKAFKKLQTYYNNNICLGERLIVTCDNAKGGFDCRYLEVMIREYILPRVKGTSVPC